ncbi:MAG: hypothetical protein HOQ05_02135 [Corynebacteriales bacterium]|nr:hypothetical protein [Mycobacteriales bacterium]
MTDRKLPDPLLAGAGLLEYVADKLQQYGPVLQQKAADLPTDAQKFAGELPGIAAEAKRLARQVPSELSKLASQLPSVAADLREKARATDTDKMRTSAQQARNTATEGAKTAYVSAVSFYDQMRARGERLVAERKNADAKVTIAEPAAAPTATPKPAPTSAAEPKPVAKKATKASTSKTAAKSKTTSKPKATKRAANPKSTKPAAE